MTSDLTEMIARLMADGKARSNPDIADEMGYPAGTYDHRAMVIRIAKITKWLERWGYLERVCVSRYGRTRAVVWVSTGRTLAPRITVGYDSGNPIDDVSVLRGNDCEGLGCTGDAL